MYFTKAALVLSFAASALALPTSATAPHQKRAAVLKQQSYAQFQVSDGVGGKASPKSKPSSPYVPHHPHPQLTSIANPPQIDEKNLAAVDPADVDIINSARQTAEAAETDAGGFNDAIAAAGKDSAAGTALQVGKIKNKVLKLKLEVLALQIDQAQGGKDNQAKIDEEQTKLDNNIKLDQGAAGDKSQSVDFQG